MCTRAQFGAWAYTGIIIIKHMAVELIELKTREKAPLAPILQSDFLIALTNLTVFFLNFFFGFVLFVCSLLRLNANQSGKN